MKILINKECISSDHEGQKILLNVETGRYLEINETGSAILNNIGNGVDIDELIELLSKKYSISKSDIEDDVIGFIREAERLKAIIISK